MKPSLLIGSLLLSASLATAQVQLNELMASNTRALPDIVDFEDYPDWIELSNPTAAAVSLANHYLSDDPGDPYKWAFPATASIPANGHLLVMADGHDAIPGQSYPRGYWPWKDFTTERYHANFSLASTGETVLLSQATAVAATTLIRAAVPTPVAPDTAAAWKYKDNGSDQSTQWRAANFDDSAWASGPAELGYSPNNEDGAATVLSYGPSSSNKHITTYFRHTFQVADPALLHNLILKLLVDDGCVVYLNGSEVVRRNLPTGAIDYRTLATAATDETRFYPYSIPKAALVIGSNVLAVEVHQTLATSSDISLDLSLSADAISGASTLDTVTYPQQVSDVSYGRDPAAAGTWKQFAEATAGAANTTSVVADVRVTGPEVAAAPAGGLHAAAPDVTLTAPAGEIRYTLDGGNPTSRSALYTAPIHLSATTVVRAACFDAGKPPGPILTRTYFLGET
ncbi:MAG: hypothetical protein RLZZ522_1086, partial [Verrucomicrobiota bacterium]